MSMAESQAEAASAIASVGLTPVLGKRVHALSKGYNRRLLLAVGLLTPHDILMVDELFDGSRSYGRRVPSLT